MENETNRTVARFTHEGEDYKIHERTNLLGNGEKFTRRFILDSEGCARGHLLWCGGVKSARKVLDERKAK